MKRVVIGSTNTVKLETTQEAFTLVFPHEPFVYIPYVAKSGVPDQPFGTEETRLGATNRAEACRAYDAEADYCVGLEGGLEEIDDELWAFAWMCVIDQNGNYGYGKAGSFLIPPQVATLIREGDELSVAATKVFTDVSVERSGSVVGVLTDGVITRKDYYCEAMIFALIPFAKPDLYF